jgi:membrane AbrB-like protein
LLLGPLFAGIVVVALGGTLAVTDWAYRVSQGVIGCMIAGMIPRFGGQSAAPTNWPVIWIGVLGVIAMSVLLGWFMTRLRLLPGSTAAWGMSPGTATAMTIMAESSGADPQLVAFMQYLRVILVAALSSVALRMWSGLHVGATTNPSWFAPVSLVSLLVSLGIAVGGVILAQRLELSSGALIIPLLAAMFLSHRGIVTVASPRWLLAIAYCVFGWRIGLRFTRKVLRHAARLLPQVLVCTLVLIGVCALLGAGLARFGGVDPLSAYLATSPGGADAVALIASTSKVDVHFVMTMQICRVVATLVLGRVMGRLVSQAETKADPTFEL